MSIFIDGMKCKICEKPVLADQKRVSFGSLVDHRNSPDPLGFFSETTFHLDCVENAAYGPEALAEQAARNASPRIPVCSICNQKIEPDFSLPTREAIDRIEDELITIPIAAAIRAPFSPSRYGQSFHRSCLEREGRMEELIDSIRALADKGWLELEVQKLLPRPRKLPIRSPDTPPPAP